MEYGVTKSFQPILIQNIIQPECLPQSKGWNALGETLAKGNIQTTLNNMILKRAPKHAP